MTKTDENEERLTHPSYGLIQINRVSGGAQRLFGSSLDYHFTTFRIRVDQATWIRAPHGDRFFGSMAGGVVEIELSAAQFVEAITSLNVGCGVPCTIRRRDGKSVERPPSEPIEAQRIKQEFKQTLKAYEERMDESRKAIEELTAKLPAKTRDAVRRELNILMVQMTSNVPYVLETFNEATNKLTNAAKAEVEAFTSHVFREAGIQAIAEGRFPNLLASGEKDSDKE